MVNDDNPLESLVSRRQQNAGTPSSLMKMQGTSETVCNLHGWKPQVLIGQAQLRKCDLCKAGICAYHTQTGPYS